MSKAIYIRTSTDLQEPKLQLADIASMVELQDCTVYNEQDSAWKSNSKRPEFELMKSRIKKGQIKHIYCWDLDRLLRNRLQLKEFMLFCKTYDCAIHSYRQNWLEEIHKVPAPWNEIINELLINVFGWMAEEESSKKSARIKNAVRRTSSGTRSADGKKWGRKSIPKQTKLRILQLAEQGMSIRQIADSLIAYDGNKNEKKISKSAVHKTLCENREEKGRFLPCP